MKDIVDSYVTFESLQSYLTDYFLEHGVKKDLREAVRDLYLQDKHQFGKLSMPRVQAWSQLSDSDFTDLLNHIPMPVQQIKNITEITKIKENDIIPEDCDVTVGRTCAFEDNALHSHDFFEICIVYKGTCQFQFENELHILAEGELCIIAPLSLHTIFIEDESSIIFGVALKKSTFDSSFFSLLTQRDLLSSFFRTLLYNQDRGNYLRFFTDNSEEIKLVVKNLFLDSYTDDPYANMRCISWINILFSDVLRNYSQSIQFYNSDLLSDFSSVLQHIQHNYRTLTLNALADLFNYHVTYLSTLIKKHTGSNYIDLVTNFKMADSMKYLKNTDMPIGEIAERVGYQTADHFSRVFKKHFDCSPTQYRKNLLC